MSVNFYVIVQTGIHFKTPRLIAEGSTIDETIELIDDWCERTSTYPVDPKAYEKIRACCQQALTNTDEDAISQVGLRVQVGEAKFERIKLFIQTK